MQNEEQQVPTVEEPTVHAFVPGEFAGIGFGVELETCVPDYSTTESDIAYRFDENSNGEPHVHGDGSIDAFDSDNGLEVATPVLRFNNGGKEYIEELCKVLQENGAYVNKSCGMHVHIGGENMSFEAIRSLWALYIAFEDVLESLVPQSRRSNYYCGSFRSKFSINKVLRAKNAPMMERMWYDVVNNSQANARKQVKHDNSRYHFLNLHSYFKDGHYEIRSHSGTVNPIKVLEWVRLHLYMRQASMRLAVSWGGTDLLKSMCNSSDIAHKTTRLFEILDIPSDARAYFLQRQAMFNRPLPQIASVQTVDAEVGEEPIAVIPTISSGVIVSSSCVA